MSGAKLADDELKGAALAHVARALAEIQQAQYALDAASAELSALYGAVPVWRATRKLRDRVHALWYRVDTFRASGKFQLDDTHVAALRRERERP